jgi:proline iminopeptidase
VMHGGLGLDHTYFRPWLDTLGNQSQIIYYDHRGNGRSARPENFDDITHGIWTSDADALRERLGFEKIILFGHSYGGYLAQEYALRYGDHLDGLILCCTAPAADFPHVIVANLQQRATPDQFQSVISALSAPVPDDATLKRVWLDALPLYFKNYDPELGAAMLEQIHYRAAAFNHSFFTCQPRFNTLARLSEISTPTLIIAGRDDWVAPPAQGAERIHAAIPDSALVVLEDSGHFPFIEEKGRFVSVVAAWLASLVAWKQRSPEDALIELRLLRRR